jgi:hypothetical protein
MTKITSESSHAKTDELGSRCIDRSVFVGMTPEQQRAHFDEHGFLMVPNAVDPTQIRRILAEVAAEAGPASSLDFAEHWPPPSIVELIVNPPILTAVRTCYGPDIRFFKGVYSNWLHITEEQRRERARQSFHLDFAAGGENGDFRNSCASWVNVGTYLVDLSPDRGPLWVIPGSRHWLHLAPRQNFEYLDDRARMVLAKAGDAVLIHCFTIHAGGIAKTAQPRHSVFNSYRPGWAQPVGPVPEWPEETVRNASPELRELLEGQNKGIMSDPSNP